MEDLVVAAGSLTGSKFEIPPSTLFRRHQVNDIMTKLILVSSLSLFGLGNFYGSQLVYAKQRDETASNKQEDGFAILKQEMQSLQTQQAQIIDQLNELKRVLSTKSALGPSAPQPPAPPTTLAAREMAEQYQYPTV